MQPDSHPGPTESHKNASATRQATASSGPRALRTAVAAWVGVFGLAALPLVSCGDDDSTGLIARGGSSGTAGAAGTAGSGAGNGGSAGSAGAAGAAGAAGTAGAGGSGGGASLDEAALAAAFCAALGQLGGSVDADAGADAAAPDAGDAGSAPSGCAASPTCLDEYTGTFAFFESESPACIDEVEAYFGCMATQPASAFICVDGVANVNAGNHGCVTQENAFNDGVVDNCAD